MSNIIEDLYLGRVHGNPVSYFNTAEFIETVDIVDAVFHQLKGCLSKQEQALLQRLCDYYEKAINLSHRVSFEEGYCLGIRLVVAGYQQEETKCEIK